MVSDMDWNRCRLSSESANKLEAAGEALFNRLDVRRAEAFAGLLHTWQAAIENEAQFTSSLLDIAHELKLSAAGIKARAEYVDIAIRHRKLEPELLQKKLGDIILNMDGILEMMSLVVTVPGADLTNTKAKIRPFKPYADLCIPVVNTYRQLAEKRGLKFEFRNEYQMGFLYADIKDFVHIFQNIIGNAVKYTDFGKSIFIYLDPPRHDSRYAAIRVASESLPIRPDERKQIFRFRFRAEAARASSAEGEGRGLAIARAKARRFKGDVVHSYLAKMNVFSLNIPKHLFHP